MKLLLDEMHSPDIADSLTKSSFDVVAVAAEARLRGMSDRDLLEHARTVGRAIVTENVADFTALARQWADADGPHAGIIFTHPKRFDRATLAYPGNLSAALRAFLTNPPMAGDSWIWWLGS